MPLPPSRYGGRTFTLAFEPSREIALVHRIWRHRESFWLCGYGSKQFRSTSVGADGSMAGALLLARELDDVPLSDWRLYEPAAGVKLFAATDSHWLRRRHRRARQHFILLRWPVCRSKRFEAALAELQKPDDSFKAS